MINLFANQALMEVFSCPFSVQAVQVSCWNICAYFPLLLRVCLAYAVTCRFAS